jgi:hypothetical protein
MILDKDDRVKTKILNAIVETPDIVLLLKEKYVDEEIWKFCIERDPSLFKKMKHPSESICMYACSIDGSNLKYIKNKFRYIKITNTMCFVSVKSNPKAILYVPDSMLNDDLKEMAFDNDPSMMAYFDDVRPEYVEKLLSEKPYAIQYIRDIDERIICNAIQDSPDIFPYLHKVTKAMAETLEKYHPAYYALYKNNIEIKNEGLGENI